MKNGETEPEGVIRSRTECTASDEVHPFYAFYPVRRRKTDAEFGNRIKAMP